MLFSPSLKLTNAEVTGISVPEKVDAIETKSKKTKRAKRKAEDHVDQLSTKKISASENTCRELITVRMKDIPLKQNAPERNAEQSAPPDKDATSELCAPEENGPEQKVASPAPRSLEEIPLDEVLENAGAVDSPRKRVYIPSVTPFAEEFEEEVEARAPVELVAEETAPTEPCAQLESVVDQVPMHLTMENAESSAAANLSQPVVAVAEEIPQVCQQSIPEEKEVEAADDDGVLP